MHPQDAWVRIPHPHRDTALRLLGALAHQLTHGDDDAVTDDTPLLDSAEARRRAQISYRQLHYWTTHGYLQPATGGGSGVPFWYEPRTVSKALLMGRLVSTFGMTPRAASDTADHLLDAGSVTHRGVTISADQLEET